MARTPKPKPDRPPQQQSGGPRPDREADPASQEGEGDAVADREDDRDLQPTGGTGAWGGGREQVAEGAAAGGVPEQPARRPKGRPRIAPPRPTYGSTKGRPPRDPAGPGVRKSFRIKPTADAQIAAIVEAIYRRDGVEPTEGAVVEEAIGRMFAGMVTDGTIDPDKDLRQT